MARWLPHPKEAIRVHDKQSKGRRLGIFKPHEKKLKAAREKKRGEEFSIELCGGPVPAKNTAGGIRAVRAIEQVDPDGALHYLESKFGEDLTAVRTAMTKLAEAYPPNALAKEAFALYEQFRPKIPEGKIGWGAKGILDLDQIASLAGK